MRDSAGARHRGGLEEIAPRLWRNVEPRVGEQTAKGVVEASVTISRLGVCVLSRSDLLISFGRKVNMEVVERLVFDVVGVFVAPAVVPTESKYPIRLRNDDREDDREVQCIDPVLPEYQAEYALGSPVTSKCRSW